MKKALLLIMVCFCMIILCACGSQPAEEATEAAEETAEQATDNTTSEAATDAKYGVELKDAQIVTNYEGKDILVVKYAFTNNSEDTVSATVALYIKAFQDGIQLENGFLFTDDLPEDLAPLQENDWKDIRPGASIDCYAGFEFDNTSEVEVEATELISFDNTILASKIYTVQ